MGHDPKVLQFAPGDPSVLKGKLVLRGAPVEEHPEEVVPELGDQTVC